MKLFGEKQKRLLAIFMMAVLMGLGVLSPKNAEIVQAAQNYPYKIMVNKQMCVVTVYEKDAKGKYTVPVKAMLCSPGVETPLGTYRIPVKYRWRLLMDDVWGQYSTRIVGGILFHSVWYYEKDPSTLSNKQFNKLGTRCSHGCVRLNVEDAKWIYDNCPIGTEVTIYESSDPGPLGKPEGIKVSQSTLMGYDPTDIWSKGNPYIEAKPVISGAKNKTVEYGKKVNLTKGITAKTSTGEDVTDEIKVTIKYKNKKVKKVNSKKTGNYYVTYKVTDKLGKTCTKEVIYTVVDNVKPEFQGIENIYLNTKLDKSVAREDVTVTWHGKEMDADDISMKWSTISKSENLNKYKVTYTYEAANGQKAKESAEVYCDFEAPVIEGVADGTVLSAELLTKEVLAANLVVKDNLNSLSREDVEVTTQLQPDGRYKVVYTVSDYAGNVTEAEAMYVAGVGIGITGVKDRVISREQVVDESFAREGVIAYENGVDVSQRVSVLITPAEDEYMVTYILMGHDGSSYMKTALFVVDEAETTENTVEELQE